MFLYMFGFINLVKSSADLPQIDELLPRSSETAPTQLKVGDSGAFVINLPSSFRQPAHDHRGEF